MSISAISTPAHAFAEFKLMVGGGAGSLTLPEQRGGQVTLGYASYSFNLGGFWGNFWGFGFSIGGVSAGGSYQQGGFTYQTELSTTTAGPGMIMRGKWLEAGFFLLPMVGTRFVAKNSSSSTVNGQDFTNSTFIEYVGSTGGILRMFFRFTDKRRPGTQHFDFLNIDIGVLPITQSKFQITTPVRSVEYTEETAGQLAFGSYMVSVSHPF